MPHRKSLFAVVALIGLASTGAAYLRSGAAGPAMTTAAQAFLASLDADQQSKALMPYSSPTRVDWHFIPKPTRKGLQIREMNAAQREAAHSLLRTALSQAGYQKATKIMDLEYLLAELEKKRVGGPLRDAERYYFTLFDRPTADGRWGLSIEGHHLSLNFVVEAGQVVSSTPAVFATNPAIVMESSVPQIEKGTRVLAREETLAFELLASLDSSQRVAAIQANKAPAEIRAAGEAQPPVAAPVGATYAKMNGAQRSLLENLVGEYAANMPADVAEARLSAIREAEWAKVHFAWEGADTPGVGHYYRVQGPTFLIEFVNVQPDAAGNPANHIHCIWRDLAGDFAIKLAK